MLRNMLAIIKRDGYISRTSLAEELKVQESMVDEGIDQLLRMGYLIKEETGENCSVTCAKCPFAKTCHKDILTTYVMATEKGD